MTPHSKSRAILMIIATMAAVFMLFAPAVGQCSMCRAALAGSNALFIRNFNIGVLVLLVPPVTIFCSIFVLLRRYKATDDDRLTEKDDPTCSNPEDQ